MTLAIVVDAPSKFGDNEQMNVPEMLSKLGEQIQSKASVKSVYGEPIIVGERTVIPIARVRYGFGGGGGGQRGNASQSDSGGQGGGGGASAAPVGVLEITSGGTRFIRIADWRKTIGLLAFGMGIGFIATKRWIRC